MSSTKQNSNYPSAWSVEAIWKIPRFIHLGAHRQSYQLETFWRATKDEVAKFCDCSERTGSLPPSDYDTFGDNFFYSFCRLQQCVISTDDVLTALWQKYTKLQKVDSPIIVGLWQNILNFPVWNSRIILFLLLRYCPPASSSVLSCLWLISKCKLISSFCLQEMHQLLKYLRRSSIV